jgi:hypothetical protein
LLVFYILLLLLTMLLDMKRELREIILKQSRRNITMLHVKVLHMKTPLMVLLTEAGFKKEISSARNFVGDKIISYRIYYIVRGCKTLI